MGDGETVILFMAEIRRSPVRVVYRYPIIYKVFFAGLIKGPAILGGGRLTSHDATGEQGSW